MLKRGKGTKLGEHEADLRLRIGPSKAGSHYFNKLTEKLMADCREAHESSHREPVSNSPDKEN